MKHIHSDVHKYGIKEDDDSNQRLKTIVIVQNGIGKVFSMATTFRLNFFKLKSIYRNYELAKL
jgi:hypothetical protein